MGDLGRSYALTPLRLRRISWYGRGFVITNMAEELERSAADPAHNPYRRYPTRTRELTKSQEDECNATFRSRDYP
jgi:hypothetical protein